jgi:DNA polymerase-4
MQRWIMHIDMDAFYASVEQLDHPELRGKPVIGGGRERGVVSAASYEARAFGVRSAMPMGQARRLCPHAIQMQGNMERYREVSLLILAVLQRFSPRVEQASIDEAYLDATGLERLFGPVEDMARRIKAEVREATGGLSCSAGIAPVKFLAKIASELNKPDGLHILRPEQVEDFLRVLPVGKIPGVGRKFEAALASLGVRTGGDVLRFSAGFWAERHGKMGESLHRCALGLDEREVEPWAAPKSESAETTLARDTRDRSLLTDWLFRHAERVGRHLRAQGLAGRVITLKVKYADFRQVTRQLTLPEPTCATDTIFETGRRLLAELNPRDPIRLIGLGVSGFDAVARQLSLPFADDGRSRIEDRRTRLDRTLDARAGKYGRGAVMRGRLYRGKAAKQERAGTDGNGHERG